jgi:hypothetical protein
MHTLLGIKNKGDEMSIKKKKYVPKKTADFPAVYQKDNVHAKRSQPIPKNPPRPAFLGIGRSFSVLLDRTKEFLKGPEKAEV